MQEGNRNTPTSSRSKVMVSSRKRPRLDVEDVLVRISSRTHHQPKANNSPETAAVVHHRPPEDMVFRGRRCLSDHQVLTSEESSLALGKLKQVTARFCFQLREAQQEIRQLKEKNATLQSQVETLKATLQRTHQRQKLVSQGFKKDKVNRPHDNMKHPTSASAENPLSEQRVKTPADSSSQGSSVDANKKSSSGNVIGARVKSPTKIRIRLGRKQKNHDVFASTAVSTGSNKNLTMGLQTTDGFASPSYSPVQLATSKSMRLKLQFDANVNSLMEFRNKFGKCRVPGVYDADLNKIESHLRWSYCECEAGRGGSMSDYRYTRLSAFNIMDADIVCPSGIDRRWKAMLKLVEIYKERHGGGLDCAVPASFDRKLHDWILDQAVLLRKAPEVMKQTETRRYEHLCSIGMYATLQRAIITLQAAGQRLVDNQL